MSVDQGLACEGLPVNTAENQRMDGQTFLLRAISPVCFPVIDFGPSVQILTQRVQSISSVLLKTSIKWKISYPVVLVARSRQNKRSSCTAPLKRQWTYTRLARSFTSVEFQKVKLTLFFATDDCTLDVFGQSINAVLFETGIMFSGNFRQLLARTWLHTTHCGFGQSALPIQVKPRAKSFSSYYFSVSYFRFLTFPLWDETGCSSFVFAIPSSFSVSFGSSLSDSHLISPHVPLRFLCLRFTHSVSVSSSFRCPTRQFPRF